MNNKPKTKIENIVVQEFDNEILIYDLSINKAFCLNQTSAIIWQLCDGTKTVSEIAELLNRKLNEPIAEDLIWLALDQFKRDGLLENEQFEIHFNGLSRRQVIKKIGFASMVALPVIASVVAPVAAATLSATQGILLSPCSGTHMTQGTCSPGLNCTTCLISTCVPSPTSQSCCAGFSGIAPGVGLFNGNCNTTTACTNNMGTCCSNSTNFDLSNCPAGQGRCTCV